MTAPFTRADYMKSSGPETHRKYYAQFVNDDVLLFVSRTIGLERIRQSTDPHFNDIPLHLWDRMESALKGMCLTTMGNINGRGLRGGIGWSLSDAVCIAKEAARQIKEGSAHPPEASAGLIQALMKNGAGR